MQRTVKLAAPARPRVLVRPIQDRGDCRKARQLGIGRCPEVPDENDLILSFRPLSAVPLFHWGVTTTSPMEISVQHVLRGALYRGLACLSPLC